MRHEAQAWASLRQTVSERRHLYAIQDPARRKRNRRNRKSTKTCIDFGPPSSTRLFPPFLEYRDDFARRWRRRHDDNALSRRILILLSDPAFSAQRPWDDIDTTTLRLQQWFIRPVSIVLILFIWHESRFFHALGSERQLLSSYTVNQSKHIWPSIETFIHSTSSPDP